MLPAYGVWATVQSQMSNLEKQFQCVETKMPRPFLPLVWTALLFVPTKAPAQSTQLENGKGNLRSAQAIFKLPDTPAGRQLAAWMAAFNSGDPDRIRQFLRVNLSESDLKEMPLTGRVERELFVYKDTGGLSITTVEESRPTEIVVVAKMKRGPRSARITLEVDGGGAHAITAVGIRPLHARPIQGDARKKLTDKEIEAQLEEFVAKQAAAGEFSGVVLIAKNGESIFEKAYGLADREGKVANTLQTKFNLGSMNKMFTGVAIMQLAEQGRLSVTDTVGKYLPDYPNKEVSERVTIQHLLTHTSGLGDYFNQKFFSRRRPLEKLADFLPFFVDQPLTSRPGSKWRYSNAGYLVLGLIVERVSGQGYYDYVKKHIYRPAGMNDTSHRLPGSDLPAVAVGYTHRQPGDVVRVRAPQPDIGSSAGGGYSTVHDLLKFDRALREHRLLDPKNTALLTTAKIGEKDFGYAYGFGNEPINGRRHFGHNGGAPGVGAQFDSYPDLGYTVVILSNYDYPDIEPVVEKTRELITR